MAELGRWTRGMRAGLGVDPTYGAVVPPLYLSTNFTFHGFDEPREYDYTRSGNPTRDLLNEALTSLEGGAGATSVATGLAAITLVAEAFVPAGGRVVVQHDAYGGTWRLFTFLASQGRFEVEFVDFNDADALDAALDRSPALVWIETPSNPLLRITDIAATAARAHAVGRSGGGGQHVPVAAVPAAARARRGHRGALHHQVHQRPLRRRWGAWLSRRTRRCTRSCACGPTRWASRRARSTPT